MIEKLHYLVIKDKKIRYLCNQKCRISESKITNDYFKVTCNTCKEILTKERIKMEKIKETQEIIDWIQEHSKNRKEALNDLEYDDKLRAVRINELTNFEESVITKIVCSQFKNKNDAILGQGDGGSK